MAKTEISNCCLWHILNGPSSLYDPEYIADLLEHTKSRLLSGLDFFKKPRGAPASKVQMRENVKPLEKEFVKKLSNILELDELQTYELYQQFLQSDFRGSKQQLENTLDNEFGVERLLLKASNFYFEERLHILQCLKYLLSYWQDDSHPFQKQFFDCVDALNSGSTLINKVNDQYKSCCRSSLPSTQAFSTSLIKAMNLRWLLQNLREQILLLEIMLLYFKEFSHQPKNVFELAKLFQSQGFGTRQANRHLFDARVESLITQISHLQVLVLIASFDLDGLRNRMEQESYEDQHLLQDKQTLQELDSLFSSWGDMREHGPVMLSWAVFRFATAAGTEQEQDVRKIGSRALQCNVFEFLHKLLLSEHFHGNSPVANTSKNVIYMLLAVALSFFQEESLGDLHLLTSVLSLTLTEEANLKDFWSSGLDTGAGLLLNSASSWFPLQMHPLLELVKSLACEENSAAKVYEYLDEMGSYTELLRDNRVGDLDCLSEDKKWKVVTPKVLYKTVISEAGQLVIPSGTLGRAFQIPEGLVAVRWDYDYSCWKLFLLEMDVFLHNVSLGSEVETLSVVGIVNLVEKILENDWSKYSLLEPFISRLYLIIHRCTPSPNPAQDLIAACLSCLATVASRLPLQVWFDLQQTGFLPHCTSVKANEDDKTQIETMAVEGGNFGVILNYKERTIGCYHVTIATLDLFLQLLRGIGFLQEKEEQAVNFLNLAACEVFLLREVFNGFHRWRYAKMEYKERIGTKCLELFNAVLGLHLNHPPRINNEEMILKDVEMSTDIRSCARCAVVLQHVLVHGLLCTEAGGSLLEVLGTGVDTIDRMTVWEGWTGGHVVALVQQIKLAFSVLNRLLLKRGKGNEVSPLEHALTTQVLQQFHDSSTGSYGTHSGQSHLITVIASYVYHRLDSKLPTLAAHLLKRLSLVAPMSMYASFGDEAVALRDAYVSRIQSNTEDVRLKVAILEFIATAVESQPGLIELFLDLKPTAGDSQDYQIGPNSCLKAVLRNIDPKDKTTVAALVAAAQMLLHALWHDRRDKALVAIRNSPNFWVNLTIPLFTEICSSDEEDYSYQIQTVSYALQIIALETYYVASGRLDASLKSVLQKFSSQGRYHYWSKFILSFSIGEETVLNSRDEQLKLLRSWRTFLVVSSSSQQQLFGLHDHALRVDILRDTLKTLKQQVSAPMNIETLASASELASLYLMLLTKWKGCIQNENKIFSGLVDILEFALKNDKQVLLRVRVPVFSAISVLLQHTRSERKSDTLDSSYAMALLPIACEPLEYLNGTLRKHDEQLDKVLVMCVLIIDEILSILLANPGQWLPVLREHALFLSLVQALDICIRSRQNLEFTEAVLHLFLSLSRINMGAESLALNGVAQPLCLSLASLFSSLDAEREKETLQQKDTSTKQTTADHKSFLPYKQWSYVWQLCLAVMASMLSTLRHGFLKEALDFAGVHRERLAQAMDSVRRSQGAAVLAEAEEVTAFLFELAHFSSEWQFSLPDVMSLLKLRAGILCQTCIALLLRPRLLAHLLELSAGTAIRATSPPLAEGNVTLSGSFSRGLLRSWSSTEDEVIRTNPMVVKTQSQLLKILCNVLAMFRHFTPDLCQILMDDSMDVEGHTPVVTLVFSSPALDHEEPLSFGTLLSSLNMCLTNISPGDIRSPVRSPVKSTPETLPRHLIMFAVENTVVIALSQASRYLRDPTVDPREKQLLKRELGSELDNFLDGLSRHFVRRNYPPSPTKGVVSQGTGAKRTPNKATVFTEVPEQQFFKLAHNLVKQMLR